MKFTDSAALLIKGYTLDEIKEINELSKTNPEVIEVSKTGAKLTDIKTLLSLADAEDNSGEAPGPDTGNNDQTADPPDYRKLLEEEKKKTAELEQKVSDIQKENNRRDLSGKQQEEPDIFEDIMSSLR